MSEDKIVVYKGTSCGTSEASAMAAFEHRRNKDLKNARKLEKALYKIQKIALVQRRNSRLEAILNIAQAALAKEK